LEELFSSKAWEYLQSCWARDVQTLADDAPNSLQQFPAPDKHPVQFGETRGQRQILKMISDPEFGQKFIDLHFPPKMENDDA
jgi:hypothetical protein